MTDYDDPVANWLRLVDTHRYLSSVAQGHLPLPDPHFYREHALHIHKYLMVITNTPECNHEVVPYLQQLIDEFDHKDYFPLNVYLIACNKLMGAKEEYDLEQQLSALSF